MDQLEQQRILLHYSGKTTLASYVKEGLAVGLGEAVFFPLHSLHVFYHTKNVNPYLLNNNIRLKSALDLYSYFKKRDGSSKIWNCFWSGMFAMEVETAMITLKRYYLAHVFNFKDSYVPDPSTGRIPKITAKKAIRYLFVSFGFDLLTSLVSIPFEALWTKMVTDYEPVPQYNHIVDCFCKAVEKDGLLGLWKAYGPSVAIRFIESAFDAFYYYRNQPNDNSDASMLGFYEKPWRYFLLEVFKYGLIYPLNRWLISSNIGEKPQLKFGKGLFSGFWIPCVPLSIEVMLKFYHLARKGNL